MSQFNEQIEAELTRTNRPTNPPQETVPDPILELDGVTRSFGSETAVDGLSLTVQEGELLTLLGPSGCGKTTTLRLLAGLDRLDAGVIRADGTPLAGTNRFVPPERRDIGLLFQEFALFPHLSVAENVAFGIQDRSATAIDRRVAELLSLVGLESHRECDPDSLSGGQRQRVALARSLAPQPDVLLLDEPFSNLDVGLRTEMREEVRRIVKTTGVTAVSVTHDQEEALSISDRIAVMAEGRIEQVGHPVSVFERPRSRFVAEFLGQAGFVTGELDGETVETTIGTLTIDAIDGLDSESAGAAIDVLVRPDDLTARPATRPESGNGQITHRQYTGPSFIYRVALDTGRVVHCEHNHTDTDLELDQRVTVSLTADHPLAWFPAE